MKEWGKLIRERGIRAEWTWRNTRGRGRSARRRGARGDPGVGAGRSQGPRRL